MENPLPPTPPVPNPVDYTSKFFSTNNFKGKSYRINSNIVSITVFKFLPFSSVKINSSTPYSPIIGYLDKECTRTSAVVDGNMDSFINVKKKKYLFFISCFLNLTI